jgi:hypothetical protein
MGKNQLGTITDDMQVDAVSTIETILGYKIAESDYNKNIMGDIMELTTKAEVIQAVRELDLHPAQIFSLQDLQGDREFSKLFDEKEKLIKQNAEKDDQIKKLGESQKDVNDRLLKTTAQERIGKLMDDKKATKEQRDFIAKRFPACKDMSDEGLKAFLDDKLDDYQAIKVTDTKKPEVPNQKQDNSGSVEPDYTKAADNELLKSDM